LLFFIILAWFQLQIFSPRFKNFFWAPEFHPRWGGGGGGKKSASEKHAHLALPGSCASTVYWPADFPAYVRNHLKPGVMFDASD
jgi:hypothetical protein